MACVSCAVRTTQFWHPPKENFPWCNRCLSSQTHSGHLRANITPLVDNPTRATWVYSCIYSTSYFHNWTFHKGQAMAYASQCQPSFLDSNVPKLMTLKHLQNGSRPYHSVFGNTMACFPEFSFKYICMIIYIYIRISLSLPLSLFFELKCNT